MWPPLFQFSVRKWFKMTKYWRKSSNRCKKVACTFSQSVCTSAQVHVHKHYKLTQGTKPEIFWKDHEDLTSFGWHIEVCYPVTQKVKGGRGLVGLVSIHWTLLNNFNFLYHPQILQCLKTIAKYRNMHISLCALHSYACTYNSQKCKNHYEYTLDPTEQLSFSSSSTNSALFKGFWQI